MSMLQRNREKIYRDEERWGVTPSGASGTRNLISEVNNDSRWVSVGQVQTLNESLALARTAFLAWANTVRGDNAPIITSAAINNPAAIYYAGETGHAILDAGDYDNKYGVGIPNNLLVGGSGNDTLVGGQGDDYVMGRGGTTISMAVMETTR